MSRSTIGFALALLLAAPAARAITRDEVMVRARSYAFHPWQSTAANAAASCKPGYVSAYTPGDQLGVAYAWGGYVTLTEFDTQIAAGLAAGSTEADGVLSCATGVDCSGFVSEAWATTHHSTSDLDQISTQIQSSNMLAGDVFNQAGYHVAMFDRWMANGEPALIEAFPPNVHQNVLEGWSHVQGYVPLRFQGITGTTGTTVTNPVGTATNPIMVTSFPFTDQRDTRQSLSSVFDACSVAPTTDESGPEYVYSVVTTSPGQLTVSVSDDATTDIDVELFTEMNTSACIARADVTFTQSVGCGTYFVVADSFQKKAGAYNLTIAFAPSDGSCASGPPHFAPKGALGDACQYPGSAPLPFCNPNLGADTCLYGNGDSYCSKPCRVDSDCSDMPGGGCCKDIGGKGAELYCARSAECGGAGSDGGSVVQEIDAGGGAPPGAQPGAPGADAPDAGASEEDQPIQIPHSGCSASGTLPSSGAWSLGALAALLTGRARRRRSRPT